MKNIHFIRNYVRNLKVVRDENVPITLHSVLYFKMKKIAEFLLKQS